MTTERSIAEVPLRFLSRVTSQQLSTADLFCSSNRDLVPLCFSSHLAVFPSQPLLPVVPSGVPRATVVASYLYLGALLGGLLLLLGFNTSYGPMTRQFLSLAQPPSRSPDSFIQTLHLSTWIANQTSQSGPDKTLSCCLSTLPPLLCSTSSTALPCSQLIQPEI